MTVEKEAAAILARLDEEYRASVEALRSALKIFLAGGPPPDPAVRAEGAFVYPELRLNWPAGQAFPRIGRAYARIGSPGRYAITITRPDLFRDYLIEQLSLLQQDFKVELEVGRSAQEIPFPYVLDGSGVVLDSSMTAAIARWFPTTDLAHIGDEISDGLFEPGEDFPLAQFDGLRTDFSLARLRHYTGTPVEAVQSYVLFTNYNRYVDEFVRWAMERLRDPNSPYQSLVCAGGVVIDRNTPDPEAAVMDAAWKKHQMPAYHLTAPGHEGITLVNIGVGPSNAKNITDHLAVLRPHCWLMIGHCGGLRQSQTIGDYVLAHAYMRRDGILDRVLPPHIPIPALAEVQVALQEAAALVTGERGEALKRRLRTGTVLTYDDRNWELHWAQERPLINLARAVAVDMESGTIAAQGYRLRVPYGTLLCVSDKPLHSEIKLPGAASAFYQRAVSQHLAIGIAAVDLLRTQLNSLHSRKLRSFDEPPFR